MVYHGLEYLPCESDSRLTIYLPEASVAQWQALPPISSLSPFDHEVLSQVLVQLVEVSQTHFLLNTDSKIDIHVVGCAFDDNRKVELIHLLQPPDNVINFQIIRRPRMSVG